MKQVITHKQGATFSYAGTVTLPAGTWSAACKVATKAASGSVTVVDTLDVTLTAPVAPATAHTILIEADATATAAWPLGVLVADVAFTDASTPAVNLPSPTFTINVEASPSNG